MKIILDFDGTIVDSYYCIPQLYKEIEQRFNLRNGFSEAMLLVEDLGDFFGIFERRDWIRFLIDNLAEEVLEFYWDERTKRQKVLDDAKFFLENVNAELYLVTSKDDSKDIKYRRIKATGLDKHFDDIIIYGEDIKNIVEAVEYLINEKDNYIYIDDKNTNIYEIKSKFSDIIIYKREFYPPFPKNLAWRYPKVDVAVVNDLKKLINIINED